MIIALDHGDRYIGVAGGNPPETPIHRMGTIDQKQEDAIPYIQELAAREQVRKILIGIPVNLEGEETEQTHKALAFMETVRENLGVEVEIEGVDETLTSVEASQNIAYEGGKQDDEHAEAARLLLVDYFSRNALL